MTTSEQSRAMNDAACTCGHDIDVHHVNGCYERDNTDGERCPCARYQWPGLVAPALRAEPEAK